MEKEKRKKKIVWQLQKRKLEDLNPYEFNPRKLTDKGMADLMDSIDKFGLAEPIIINLNSNIIIGGHARYFTLLKLKEELCDCYVPDRELTEKEMKELNIRLNKNIAGQWDLDILSDAFQYEELLSWGFTEDEIDIKLWEPEVPEDKLDDVPEPQKEAVSQLGDIFLLGGKHRILCGDSTKKEDVEMLLQDIKPELQIADPPYDFTNVKPGKCNRTKKSLHYFSEIEKLNINHFDPASINYFFQTNIFFHNKELLKDYPKLAESKNLSYDLNIYHKTNGGLGFINGHMLPDLEYISLLGKLSPNPGLEKKYYSKYFGSQKDHDNPVTWSKPVKLCEKYILLFSKIYIYDSFLGSGSTLIAS